MSRRARSARRRSGGEPCQDFGADALSTGPILGVRRTTPALAPSYRNCAHGTTILRRPNLDGVRKNPETNDATPTTGPSTPREKCVSNYLGAASPTSEPPKSAYSPRVHPPARPPAGVPGAALARFVGFDRYLRAPRQGFGLRPRLRPARRAVPRATSAVWSKTGRRPILPLAAPIKIGPSVSWTVPYVQPTGKMRNSRCASAELAISMFSHATSLLPTSPAARRSTELKWPLGWAQKFERKSKVRSTLLPIALSFDFYRSRAHKRRPFPRRRSSARKLTLKCGSSAVQVQFKCDFSAISILWFRRFMPLFRRFMPLLRWYMPRSVARVGCECLSHRTFRRLPAVVQMAVEAA